jgi:hypothetical protein
MTNRKYYEDKTIILVDLNQVMISNVLQQINIGEELDEDFFRHMILNSLRSYRKKYGTKYGELMICCDDKNFWRRDKFPYYKAHRKKNRADSKHDWNAIFGVLNTMRDDLKEHFPYLVLHVENAEADDLIASMCHIEGKQLGGEPILIMSSDKDFIQLQKYSNVEQYSPMQKKFVRHHNPEAYIKEHIIKGDRGDGIPNFLSDDDTFVVGKRQKAISTKKLETWINQEPAEFCDEDMLRNWNRNNMLINLDLVPANIQDQVNDIYKNRETPDRSRLFNYFIKNKLKGLMDSLTDF